VQGDVLVVEVDGQVSAAAHLVVLHQDGHDLGLLVVLEHHVVLVVVDDDVVVLQGRERQRSDLAQRNAPLEVVHDLAACTGEEYE
jgi:hypothetical protein